MKTLVSSMIVLGLISAAPAFAEKPAWAGKGQATAQQAQGGAMQQQGQGEMHQKKMQHQGQAGQGEMHQKKMQHQGQAGKGEMHQKKMQQEGQGEMHRKTENKQVGMDTGKGAGGGKASGDKPKKQWWKFWE